MKKKSEPTNRSKLLTFAKEKKRLLAEITNLQKQHLQHLEEMRQYGKQDLLEQLLEVLNSFEMALNFPVRHEETKKFFTGVKMTDGNLRKILAANGLTPIDCTIGESFNEHFHEAFGIAWNPKLTGETIIKIVQTGYRLHQRVLQPTKVIVNRRPSNLKKKIKKG